MNYSELETFLEKKIPNARVEVIGTSVLKRQIYCVYFDMGSDESVIIHGAIHAREHITCDLIIKLISDLSASYEKYRAMKIPNVAFVPMVNPDGVELCHFGLRSVKSPFRKRILKTINGSNDFSLFKANANGVDLNNNFDAKWGSGKASRFVPSPHGFVGDFPMSEPEVQALALLTIRLKPFFTISYHCKGEEVYYEFYNKPENKKRDKKIAKIVAKTLGYKLVNLESESSGGYKDWCVSRLKIPAVTIEVGKDSLFHPLDISSLEQIYKRNKNILKSLSKIKEEFESDRRRKIHEEGT